MATESLPERPASPRGPPGFEPRRGLHLGRYELLAPLASGGMAQVWIGRLAGEHGFERLVAIKTMLPEHAESQALRLMFLDEARLAARIAHSNVVEVLDLGEQDRVVYQAMPLVDGAPLGALLKRRAQLGARGLPPGAASRIVGDVLNGLHAAHELLDDDGRPLQLVHRDVSPQNVLVGLDGVAKIADFGIAKARSRLADETDAGQVKGKYAYMAPEQLARRPVDRRADVFSTGVVLWEALTGKRLFGGVDLLETLAKLQHGTIPDPRSVAPDVPSGLAEVTMRALARDPAERFATAGQMSDAIESAAVEAGVVTGAKDVGALVADLCGEDLERRRATVRQAVRDLTLAEEPAPGPAETLTATTIAPIGEPTEVRPTAAPWRARVAIVAAIVASAALLVTLLRPGAPAAAPVVASSPASSTPLTADPPAIPPELATGVAPGIAPPASTPSVRAASPAVSAAPLRHARPAPSSTAGPHIRYGNPYGP